MADVLFITRKWPPAVGGMETYSYQLVKELSEICKLKLHALPGRADGKPPTLFSLAFFMLTSVLFIFKQKRCDAIHIGDLVLWPLCFFSKIFHPSADLVITAYGLDIVYGTQKGFLPKLYKAYLFVGVKFIGKKIKVIAISNSTAKLCQNVGFPNVIVVPLGVSKPIVKDMEDTEIKPYVLFVGRLVKRKGAGWFVNHVLPLISKDLHLIVVGKCWDDSEWNLISDNNRVEYLGVVSDDELSKLRSSAIAVLMPNISTDGSDIEGFGLTALEAAADGGILLASGIEGIVDAVIDGKTGFLLPSGEPDAWVEKIHEVMTWSNKKRNNFIRESKKVVAEKYSWERVAKNTFNVYFHSI